VVKTYKLKLRKENYPPFHMGYAEKLFLLLLGKEEVVADFFISIIFL
jgi:hypothetical protein